MGFGKSRILGWVVWLLLLGASASAVASHPIASKELVDRIATGQAPMVLDVRTPDEYAQSHIPGAVNIPVADLLSRVAELSQLKDEEIVVYCQLGPRAAFAGYVMTQNGFTGVRGLQAHMQQWLADGHPVKSYIEFVR